MKTKDIREQFVNLLQNKKFTSVNREASMTNLVGSTTIEIIGASFIADEDAIFGNLNHEYALREEAWYNSMSLNVYDIPGDTPAIWKAIADKDGLVNSNYGWMIYHPDNGSQYENAVKELIANPESRRSEMIYNRPTMWVDYNKNGRSDFCCTNAVQYLIRNGAVHAVVQMRSSDSVMGYKNDRHWQLSILEKLTKEVSEKSNKEYKVGDIIWNAGSLHVYSRHFYLIDPINYTKP